MPDEAASASADDAVSLLDLTSEAPDPAQVVPRVATIEQQREDTRRTVAVSLLVGLAVLIAAWGAVGIWGDKGDVVAAGDAFRTAFTGVLALTGTVVGFYFGGGNGNGQKQ